MIMRILNRRRQKREDKRQLWLELAEIDDTGFFAKMVERLK